MPKFPGTRIGRCGEKVVDLFGISDESIRLAIAVGSTDFAESAQGKEECVSHDPEHRSGEMSYLGPEALTSTC
jgi:hypothetical protein